MHCRISYNCFLNANRFSIYWLRSTFFRSFLLLLLRWWRAWWNFVLTQTKQTPFSIWQFGNSNNNNNSHKNIHNFCFLLSVKMIWTASCQHTAHTHIVKEEENYTFTCIKLTVRCVCESVLLFNDKTRHMHTWSKLPGIISERFSASIPNVNSHWQQ